MKSLSVTPPLHTPYVHVTQTLLPHNHTTRDAESDRERERRAGPRPETRKKGNALKLGQLVIDNIFGEGEVRGTEPLEKGAGVNVLIRWVEKPDEKPRSRGAQHLTQPQLLDESLIGKLVFIRWESPWGWSLGTIIEKLTKEATPRLFKKFNYRVKYMDGSKGPANLPLVNYAHGAGAAYNSWCLLEKEEE